MSALLNSAIWRQENKTLVDLVGLIERIPATFWGVVIGSLFTITGVVLTNRSNTERLRTQLEHDRNLKSRERDLALRKDIYLAAAEAILTGIGALGRFCDLSVPYEKLMQSFADKAPSIAKVHIVANDDTTKTLAAFMDELTCAFLRFAPKRIKLDSLQQSISFVQEQMDLADKERDRMVAIMKEYNLAGIHDKQRWAALQQNFDFEGQKVQELTEKRSALQMELSSTQLCFVQECLAEIAALDHLLTPVIGCVRAELELPFNENSYAEVIEVSRRKRTEHFQQFLRDTAAGAVASSPGEC